MKNVAEMRDELQKAFFELKEEKLSPRIMTELNNAVGKMTASVKAELQYYALRQEKPEIPYLSNKTTKEPK